MEFLGVVFVNSPEESRGVNIFLSVLLAMRHLPGHSDPS